MNSPILFSTFLHDRLNARRMTCDELAHELDVIPTGELQTWLDGQAKPTVEQLPLVARALRLELAEVAAGWLIDSLPELEGELACTVLDPRHSNFPKTTDLALRAPVIPPVEPHDMHVGDPHDEDRDRIRMPALPLGRLRKRPATR